MGKMITYQPHLLQMCATTILTKNFFAFLLKPCTAERLTFPNLGLSLEFCPAAGGGDVRE